MIRKISMMIAMVTILAGCATKSIHEFTVEELANITEVDRSDFSESIVVRGINIRQQSSQHSVLFVPQTDYENIFLRSIVERDSRKIVAHQVYVSISYRGDWRFYRSANLAGGESLDVTEISSNVITCADSALTGCRLSEDFAINLTQAQFESGVQNGLTFRANTDFSDRFNDFSIPDTVFKAQARVLEGL